VTCLILNADDFGLTPGVNRSVVELQEAGALTSATLMATADGFAAAAAQAIGHPRLGVGCHIVLVDGMPVLPRSEIPGLATASGEFRPTLGAFVRDLMRGKIPEAEIEAEAVAQIRRLQSAGIDITHVDTHKHTHMFVKVLRPLLRAARECGVGAIRNPFEPGWAIAVTPNAPSGRRWQVRLLRARRHAFVRLVRKAGLATTDGAIGVLATGILEAKTLRRLLSVMPEGTWELVCHPGYMDAELEGVRTRLRESRVIEHAAILDVVRSYVQEHPEINFTHFGQLRVEHI
jgi:chitin disaccharide deacetylase